MSSTPQPKAMSSRLLTMKFMQRAAAVPTPPSPSSPDQPPAKRQKQSEDSKDAVFDVNSLVDNRAVQAAIAAEERLNQAALDRAAEQAGDSHWVLHYENEPEPAQKCMQVEYISYATIDSFDNEDPTISYGRRSYNWDKATENAEDSASSESDDEQDSEDAISSGEEEDDPTGTNAMIKAARLQAAVQARAERKAKKKADKAENTRLAGLRKKKEVNLNNQKVKIERDGEVSLRGLSSISGVSGGQSNMPMHKRKRDNGNANSGRPQKSRKSS